MFYTTCAKRHYVETTHGKIPVLCTLMPGHEGKCGFAHTMIQLIQGRFAIERLRLVGIEPVEELEDGT